MGESMNNNLFRKIARKIEIRNIIKSIEDSLLIQKGRRYEVNKFNDPRRKAIYSNICLTDEQKKLIDDFYVSNYGEKIPYTWHRHYTAYTGKFDEKYFPELLYTPEFEHFMNINRSYCAVLSDKSITPFIAKVIDINTPYAFLYATKGIIRDSSYRQIDFITASNILQNIGEVFCKPSTNSSSGERCIVADFHDGFDNISGLSTKDILRMLGEDFVVQERIKCHESIRKIYDGSVNTFRIITYRWNDDIKHFPLVMRIGKGGSYLDNAHAGGIFIAVDDDGTLHEKAFTEFKEEYVCHPDTSLILKDYRIPSIKRVLLAAERMHMAFPEIGVVNWDFTIDIDENPVLIEANLNAGAVWISEMAHGCGAFGDQTAEVLRWIRFMKRIKINDRNKYAFGRFTTLVT